MNTLFRLSYSCQYHIDVVIVILYCNVLEGFFFSSFFG